MSYGASNLFACGLNRRGSYRGHQIVYGKYLNNCNNVRKNLTDWLKQRNIVLVPRKEKDKNVFPLLSIMYLDDVEEYYSGEDFPVEDLGFRGLLVLIHENTKPRRQIEENVIQLRSEKSVICKTRQNEEEIERMKRFIQEKATMLAFSHDRKNPDSLLLYAVKFLEKEFNIHLVDVNDPPKYVRNVKGIEESPLVIFCKNDSQLQEDIYLAKRNARCGSDVMLLVLTYRKDMHLVDTKATEGFCMKSQLIFSSRYKRFRKKENQGCTMWLHKFLLLNGYNVSRKLSRSESLKRSFRQLRKRVEEGLYKKLQNVSEEMERSVVIYLEEKQNLSLHRMEDDYQESRPFILFCRDGESAEDDINNFIKERQATSDLHMTVVLLTCKGQKSMEIPNVPNIQRLLIHSSQEPRILPTPANGRVSDIVREFLLAERYDKESIIFTKMEQVTHKARRYSEEENKMSVATNSVKRPPETSCKYVTHLDMREPAVYFTYGQSRLNYRLMEAVTFVKAKGCIDLIEVKDIQKSPLLVFCDGRNSENSVRAKQSSRYGSDVMLIMVTDTEHTDLNVVEENEIFGARHTLIWDYISARFNEMDNQKCIDVLQVFLSTHNIIVNMTRTQTVPADHARRPLVKSTRISIEGHSV